MSDNHPCQSLASVALAYARTLQCVAAEVMVEQRCTRIALWETSAVLSAVSLEPQEKISMAVRVYFRDGKCGLTTGTVSSEASARKLVDSAAARAAEGGGEDDGLSRLLLKQGEVINDC